jgi:CoA:oxalate CoA-transferase
MVDGLFFTLENAIVRYTSGGEVPRPLGTAHPSITPFQAFRTWDSWIIVAVGSDKLWARFCTVLRRTDLVNDARFRTNPLRTQNRVELATILTSVLAQKTTVEWTILFEKEGIPYSPVNNIEQICQDPHIRHRNMLVEVEQKSIGKLKIVGSPFRLSETPGKVFIGAPLLGEHSEEILREVLGITDEEITSLKKQGVIN